MYVEEKDRSWCSSNAANDHRAVTIECASDTTAPYAMKDAVYNSLITLCTDICKRNGKTKLIWFGDKTKTLAYTPKSNEMIITVHRWFANKSCPGDWLYSRLDELAAEVTKRLGGTSTTTTTTNTTQATTGATATNYRVKITATVLNIRKGPGTSYAVTGQIKDKGVYTIVQESNGWGKLKSGAGWISLTYAKKL
jgi:hypothetical protein